MRESISCQAMRQKLTDFVDIVQGDPAVDTVTGFTGGGQRNGGFMFVFRPGVIDQAPHAFVGFLRGPQESAARARLQADLVKAAPNVSVIDGREILDTIKSVVDNVTLAVTVVGTLVARRRGVMGSRDLGPATEGRRARARQPQSHDAPVGARRHV